MNIIEQIEEIMGDLSPANLISNGYIRLNACDVGLDIRAGTLFLDVNNEAIVVLGNTRNIEYYGGFEYIEEEHTMKVQMGNQKVSIYLAESSRVEECFEHYKNVYLPDFNEENTESN